MRARKRRPGPVGLETARPRVLILGLDGFPPGAINAADAPALWGLAAAGGRAVDGGIADLPSTTYPGFASLLTGRRGGRTGNTPGHGVLTTSSDGKAVSGWEGRRSVRMPTLLHVAQEAGLAAGAILGDNNLHRVLALGDLTRWPRSGRVPGGTLVDAHGYPTNQAAREPLLRTVATGDWRVLFAHLNEVDTLGHDHGPDDPRTLAGRRATDTLVGELLDALRPDWGRTLVMVASDHGMEAVSPLPAIDPAAVAGLGKHLDGWIGDGGAAWVRVKRAAERDIIGSILGQLDGIALVEPRGERKLLLAAQPGREFAGERQTGGVHGAVSTARTLAIVGGGLDAVAVIAASIAARPPHLADWAPAAAAVLGLGFGLGGDPVLLAAGALAPAGR